MNRDIVPFKRRRVEPPSGERDALGEYLAKARVWEQMPWLMDRDLARYGFAASVVSIALGLVGVWAASSAPPRGFFLVGAGTILGFMALVFAASKLVLVIGIAGVVVASISWTRPTGVWARAAVAGECAVAGVAAAADIFVVFAILLELLVWVLLITAVIIVGLVVLGIVCAALGG